MSRVHAMQTSFNGGEMSPFMFGRVDHEIYPVALAQCIGFAPRPQGPLETCPGFEYVETAPGSCRLIPFEPYVTQGHVIEASDELLRFYTNDVLLESGGAPVTVVAPWSATQLSALDYEQSNDVLYMVHGDVAPRLLVRNGAASFSLELLELENGPFENRNNDEDLTITFDGVTGEVTVTASNDLFEPGDVGGLLEVEANDLSNIPAWEPGITVSVGSLLQWEGRVYQVVGGAERTGSVQPIHTRGVEWDGIAQGQDVNETDAGGVQLAYLHDMFGRVRLTEYVSATEMTATVIRRLPSQLASSYQYSDYGYGYFTPGTGYDGSGSWTVPTGGGTTTEGTWRWRFGAFSDRRGWPEHVAIWNQRLILTKGDTIYGSVVGSLTDFDRLNELGDISRDQAFTVQIDNPNPIRWLLAGAELFVGTAVSEHVLRAASAAEGVGPGNIKLDLQERRGSAAVRAVELEGRPLFIQRNQRKMLFMQENSYNRFTSEDMTRYADHIGDSAFLEMAWQKEPMQILWAVRADGSLVGCDYMPQEQVLGWFQRPLGGGMEAKSVTAITSPDGLRDQLWLAAELDGETHIMLMAEWRQADSDAADPLMFDAGLTYDDPANPISTLSLPHLAGRTVGVVGDGLWLGDFVADGSGNVELDEAVGAAQAGLNYAARVSFLPMEGGGDNGPAQGKVKRVARATLRLQRARGLTFECQGGHRHVIENVYPDADLTLPIPVVTRDEVIDVIGHWNRPGQLYLERHAPFPSTILALMAEMETSQR